MTATTLMSSPLGREQDRAELGASTPSSSHPPSSFDLSKIPNGRSSSSPLYSTPNASNVTNLLNTRPVYDRSNSALASKRSSMVSSLSFRTARDVPGSAYGGGSVYGTADGGSSRSSIGTVQYEASTNPSPIPAQLNGDQTIRAPKPSTRPTTATSLASASDHPGNDLPSDLATSPSPLDIEVVNVRTARVGTPPREDQIGRNPSLRTTSQPTAILTETSILSTSPSGSPMVPHNEKDGLQGVMRRYSESADTKLTTTETTPFPNLDLSSGSNGITPRDFSSAPDPTSDLTFNMVPGKGEPHPDNNLLHPSSAASVTPPSSANIPQQPPRPIRRNTTGSTGMPAKSKSSSGAPPMAAGVAAVGMHKDEWDLELDEDMKKQAEQIRRERKRRDMEAAEEERLERERERDRGKGKASEKERVHSRSGSTGGKSVGGKSVARSTGGKSIDEWRPVVGNVVGEGHVNYILMYNMLTGIRVAVSRCTAKAPRSLTDADYTAAHKYNFDVIGNELTPSAKYDFKFKDYAPWVFRSLREESFNIDPADYLLSLTSKYILSELGSPGKSGSFFYYSRDYRFIIKTIRAAEHKWLRRVLKDYYRHVQDNPHTLISRFYGLHRVKLPRGHKIHFVIMNNLFPAHRDIHETYDLKGSTVGRLLPENKIQENPGAVMKDLNWIERGRVLEFGPYKRALLTEQLRRDVEFLKSIGVMDYSLLVGLHSIKRGNKEKIRSTTLKVFRPDIKDVPDLDSPIGARKWIGIKHAMEVRRAILQAQRQHQSTAGTSASAGEPFERDRKTSQTSKVERGLTRRGTSRERLGTKDKGVTRSPLHTLESSNLPEEDPLPSDRSGFIFYSDDGGYRATDDMDKEWQGGLGGRLVIDGKIVSDEEAMEKGQGRGESDGEGVVYYLGVIDILTKWNFMKKVEHFYKGLKADRRKISPVNPQEYGDRFFSFMQAVMRGGEGGERFV